jgi:two-component system cell cycle response regulator
MIDSSDSQLTVLLEPSSSCRVLIVDDDELVLRRLTALVLLGGYETRTASSGAAALQILTEAPCQIVLTDWHMPDMDGRGLVTARSARSDIVAGLAAGADDYVVKSATTEELLARIGVGRRISQLERSLPVGNRKKRRSPITDAVTGVGNRLFLLKYLPRELERARHSGQSFAILSCNIDGLKQVNDDHGHKACEELLREFVIRAAGCIRQATGWIARSAGEEFVLVLPQTSQNDASYIAARLRQAFAANPIPTSAGPLGITVSIGIAALETPQALSATSALTLLRAADRGLYASKRLASDRATTMAARHAQWARGLLRETTREPG